MIETPFNYTGSKFKLLNQLLPLFDSTKTNFVDVFAGGGSIYTNVVDKYEKILVNDIISDLIGIHENLISGDKIIEETKSLCKTLKTCQDDFLRLRKDYNSNPSPDKLWALMLSCNSNLIRFNQKGEFNQTWGRRSYNSNTDLKVKAFKEHIRKYVDKIEFSSKNFNEIVVSENTFYYIDPPYGYVKNEDGSIGNKQISEAGYNNFYYKSDDFNLYDFCHRINKIGSTFVISGVLEHGGKKSWLLEKLITDGFLHSELKFNYEKINKSGSNKGTREIIIKNF
jgi:adenine-specific DNA-methyltransferase